MAGERALNVVIVGCGNIAGGFDADRPSGKPPLSHAGAYLQHGGFRIVAAIEPDHGRREAFQRRWNTKATFASFEDFASSERTDVVSICSPTSFHAEHLEAALRLRPRLIFCEKPLTLSIEESERLIARCEKSGISLAVNYSRRWAPDVERLRKALAAGELGVPRSIVGFYNKGVLHNGGHMVDLLHHLLGRPLFVVATGPPVWDFFAEDPTVPALLRTEDGLCIHLVAGHAADYSLFELQLLTSTASIAMEDSGFAWRKRQPQRSPMFSGYRQLDPGQRTPGEVGYAMANAVANIYEALTSGAELASTGRTALTAQRLCEQIRSAGLAGRRKISG